MTTRAKCDAAQAPLVDTPSPACTVPSMHARSFAVITLATILGCGAGSSASPAADDAGTPVARADAGAQAPPMLRSLGGRWEVEGRDARGAYRGHAELVADGAVARFRRAVRYVDVRVEGGRELEWAWQGTASGAEVDAADTTNVFENRDFVARRGDVVRTLTDAPITVRGRVRLDGARVTAHFEAPGLVADETWSNRIPAPSEPLFTIERSVAAAHPAPSAAVKAASFQTYASFHALPRVAPYVSRPDFQAAVHGIVTDRTDFAFYRASPDVLRVIDKSVDAVSLGETLARANAFRFTLAEKATRFDADMQRVFIDPMVGMVVDGGPPGAPKNPTGDGALWTATYLASQVYRFQVTGEAAARQNAIRSLQAILTLQEITGDPKTFARTLRKAGSGAPSPRWHAGTGAYAGLEWLDGGNNDMMKGLLYGNLLGWLLLCKSGSDPMCGRIRTNVRHIADDIETDQGFNQLGGAWLAAIVETDPVQRTVYRARAEGLWAASRNVLVNNPTLYAQGIADWSGTHLNFTSNVVDLLMADELDLGGDAKSKLHQLVETSFDNLAEQRLVAWDVLRNAFGAAPDPIAQRDALWGLREFPYPKVELDVDHRVSPSFSLSPYPSLPWKNDWTEHDRTKSLVLYPYFEVPSDVCQWKSHFEYLGSSVDYETPGEDYLHAYWFARRHGIFSGSE